MLVLTYKSFVTAPKGFIPSQDKGYLLVNAQLPDSASLERTRATMQTIEQVAAKIPGVKHTVAIAGQSILLGATAPNFGAMYVMLDEFHHRAKERLTGDVVAAKLQAELQHAVSDGVINIFGAPPVEGLGTAGGFKIVIEDRGDSGSEASAGGFRSCRGRRRTDTRNCRTCSAASGRTARGCILDIDRAAAKRMGLAMDEVFNTLQVYLGSLYVNDFNRFGRTWQVNVQAAANFRSDVEDLKRLKIRNDQRPDGAAGRDQRSARSRRPDDDHALQSLPCGRDQRQPYGRRQFRKGAGADGASGPAAICRVRCGPNGPNWRCCSFRPAIRP